MYKFNTNYQQKKSMLTIAYTSTKMLKCINITHIVFSLRQIFTHSVWIRDLMNDHFLSNLGCCELTFDRYS